jgi:vacuolar-type H+-ATPase subunit I/STV1
MEPQALSSPGTETASQVKAPPPHLHPSIENSTSPSGLETRSSSISTKINLSFQTTFSNFTEYTLASRYGSKKLINSSYGKTPKRALDLYAIKKTLGEGSFAKVKLCQNIKNGEKLAVKIIEKSKVKSTKLRTSVKREIRLNKLIWHPHIAQVYEMLETESTIFIMMEYIEGGELFNYIIGKRHLGEKEARHFFRQIISAIDYLHRVSFELFLYFF